MKQIGAFEAKTHFSELLVGVEKNKDIYIITRHGHEVAMLVPIERKNEISPVNDAIKAIKEQRKGIRLGKNLSIAKMKAEGRA